MAVDGHKNPREPRGKPILREGECAGRDLNPRYWLGKPMELPGYTTRAPFGGKPERGKKLFEPPSPKRRGGDGPPGFSEGPAAAVPARAGAIPQTGGASRLRP